MIGGRLAGAGAGGAFTMLCLLASACTQPPIDDPLPMPTPEKWTLVWSDEFDGPAMAPVDQKHWKFDIGGGGFGNQQLEFNTNELANSHQDGDGNLVITARKQRYSTNEYTSARINTAGKHEQLYGRFEARIELSAGAGLWPAFWLLGANISKVGWPECGELDIMEQRGSAPQLIHGSAHGPGYSGGNPRTASYTLGTGASAASGFHEYAVEWSPGEVHWFVDGAHYHAITEATMAAEHRWVFDGSMFVILDLAVGGTFGGKVDDKIFPKSMRVDYVRVYQAAGMR